MAVEAANIPKNFPLHEQRLLCPRFSSPWTAQECALVTGAENAPDSQPSADLMDNSPWFSDVPTCYITNKGAPQAEQLKQFTIDTLFYFFYFHPQTALQVQVASELTSRGWRLHKPSSKWIILEDPPSYFCPTQWLKW
eukprot:Blabericola_migrator_1__6029@NODE_3039_length_2092_cov_231_218272_g1898_i0_p2_GENE_NODE_3039_length_2092_cov_231_218272_g1898_i0NODE_3039_length_2092_cov_231_218272_g1898_i0_p2_ORF_typecomplete_len138_score14_97NOT2_3_5/PF04153_18/6e15_NODE_3039_length_2092_cov_231_218272_g1898_i011351548